MYVLSIALRHLRTRSITWVAMTLIAIIVLLYLLIISVLEGSKAHFMDKLQSILAHTTVSVGELAWGIQRPEAWAGELAKADPGIKGVTIGLESPALAVFDNARTVGTLRGIDLPRELQYGRLKEMLSPPGLTEFGMHEQGQRMLHGCIVGGALRKSFGLKVGDRVTLSFTNEEGDPRSFAFAIIGFFESNNPYLESGAYVDRKFLAEQMQVPGMAKTLLVWLKDPNRPDLKEFKGNIRAKMLEIMKRDLENYDKLAGLLAVDTWQEKDNGFYKAITRENLIMRFIMGVFLALIAFVIFLIFGRLVAEKIRDIGALRALGATPAGIRRCFLAQGLFIGLFGLLAGLAVSYVFISNVNEIANFFGLDPLAAGDSFGTTKIPTVTLPCDIMMISLLTVASALAGAFFPAWRASRLNPVECLRHE